MGKMNEAGSGWGRWNEVGGGPHSQGAMDLSPAVWNGESCPVEWGESLLPPRSAGLERAPGAHTGASLPPPAAPVSLFVKPEGRLDGAPWCRPLLPAPGTSSRAPSSPRHIRVRRTVCLGQKHPPRQPPCPPPHTWGLWPRGQSSGLAKDTKVLVSHALKRKQC